jgi:lipoprotein-releasing system permease protein
VSLLLFMALRQLWARRGLNATAICGVALGVFMLILISAVMRGLQAKFLTNMTKASAHVTVLDKELRPEPPMLARFEDALVATRVSHENPSDRQTRVRRPDETVRMLERLPGVVAAAPSVGGSGIVVYGGKEYPVEVRGISPVRQDRVTPLRQYVTTGSYRAFSTGSDVVMLGSGVASRTGAKVGDAVLLSGPRGNRMTLHVAAICDSNIPPIDNVRVYVPLASAQAVLGRPDVVSRIDVRVADPDDAPQMTERVERILGYDAESWQEQNANFLGLFVQQRTITSMVIGAILLVGGFGILAIQIMIVLQKTRDIAIMRSYGFLTSAPASGWRARAPS